jgi:hypothetical protein
MSTPPLSAQDLRAAAGAHRELGPEYSDAIVDSFLEKIETRLDERVNARLAELVPPRKRLLAGLSEERRRILLNGMAIGVGGIGVWFGLVMYRTGPFGGRVAGIPHGPLWAWVLVVSAGACGAGLARMFHNRR